MYFHTLPDVLFPMKDAGEGHPTHLAHPPAFGSALEENSGILLRAPQTQHHPRWNPSWNPYNTPNAESGPCAPGRGRAPGREAAGRLRPRGHGGRRIAPRGPGRRPRGPPRRPRYPPAHRGEASMGPRRPRHHHLEFPQDILASSDWVSPDPTAGSVQAAASCSPRPPGPVPSFEPLSRLRTPFPPSNFLSRTMRRKRLPFPEKVGIFISWG